MLDFDALDRDLEAPGLQHWREPLQSLCLEKLSDPAHGRIPEWRRTLQALPRVSSDEFDFRSDAVTVASNETIEPGCRELLLSLAPWRKGPFRIGDIFIDAEWQSNLKWDRIAPALEPLRDRAVLDVGCGNGYYTLRLLGHGARIVIGIDPTVLYVVQFLALRHFMPAVAAHVLPLRLHELPPDGAMFDTTLSMGVLYHQRDPLEHLRQLRATLRPRGQLLLETLIVPGSEPCSIRPENRYARMRNVWQLPTWRQLAIWLEQSGFRDITLIDRTTTSVTEQRTTEWMPFESLAEALAPGDPARTIEGLPAPCRAVVSANVA
ncbi:MAG: tRNA 5-methoxyuridine(34)/uridine 5-oxyacetic acid(34) synthase CmoB [Gammaproteobacteria bacterium]|nr:tRNA 5-methoxyuridine(34)/uridine 5-oxyacetic acid(34) synthase CmoB [Gammaproteobacteria bacterium]